MNKVIILTILMLTACGPRGRDGARGQTGLQGVSGASGAEGSPGYGCTVKTLPTGSQEALNGGSLITCGDGSSSLVLNGSNGTNGSDGAQGQAGTPGTVVAPVQFCSGLTASYPNTFPESGFCINNKMFGVYSDHGGFMAELPPGTYSSYGINASCTFTIGNNCAVSQ